MRVIAYSIAYFRVCAMRFYYLLLYRKVTTWARVQPRFGLKVLGLVPVVTPCSTAQATAWA